jgi:hypothetical protein
MKRTFQAVLSMKGTERLCAVFKENGLGHQSVIPANAGIQAAMDSRIRGNDGDGFVTKAIFFCSGKLRNGN